MTFKTVKPEFTLLKYLVSLVFFLAIENILMNWFDHSWFYGEAATCLIAAGVVAFAYFRWLAKSSLFKQTPKEPNEKAS
jgi:hypothetical protein